MKKVVLNILFVFLNIILLMQCNTNKNTSLHTITNHSFSNYTDVKTTHLNWIANINFNKKIIEATTIWHFKNINNATQIVFDTKNLNITKVLINQKEIAFKLDTADHNYMGSALQIPIQPNDSIVEITYTTSPNAKALQWLTAQQTADKKMPYLFSQCEAIACRSMMPCQDAPAVRITYNATVTVPAGMMAVMSADNPQKRNVDGKYNFTMNIPIPSYLIALAVGDIDFKAIDGRSGVYAEPSVLQNAATELSDIPKMIASAEQLAGPYRWGRYDVLIQPPSFPIGGMENPKLTFATPTILAGDKSLVSLIAHELAHSWSGNTVTNATWDDLWLNEGFTTYFEKRIMENITDTTYTDMLWELSYQDMMEDVKNFGDTSADTKLKLNTENRDPEDAFSNIPYEKGAHLLWLIEKTVGRKTFDSFMVNYFNTNAFVPMTTENALDFMDKNLWNKNPDWKKTVGVDEWVYKAGIPKNCPKPGHTRFDAISKNKELLLHYYSKVNTSKWTTHEWLFFLRGKSNTNLKDVELLDGAFHFTNTKNAEIAFEWYMLCLKTNYKFAFPKIENFLLHVGRKKFVLPLYKQMLKDPTQATLAKNIFAKAKDNYHPNTTEAVLELMK